MRFAVRDLGLESVEQMLVGPTAIAFVDGDAAAVAKALRDYGRTNPALVVKGGLLGARPMSADAARALADLPSRELLLAQLAGGLAAPADIALAGFDDIGTLRDVYPPLTTVRLPLKRMGEMAAGLILAEPPGTPPEQQPRVVPVPGEVILRESTLPHPRRLSPETH